MTKYYVDDSGAYIGGFDGAEPPIGSTEVAQPPEDGRQRWSMEAWEPLSSLIVWQAEIAATDADMPRYMENHIENDHGGIASDAYTQEKYDEKKAIRARQPE